MANNASRPEICRADLGRARSLHAMMALLTLAATDGCGRDTGRTADRNAALGQVAAGQASAATRAGEAAVARVTPTSELPSQVAAAFAAVGKQLGGELKSALAKGGPVNAIEVCNHRAPLIVADVQRPGIRIGRTSHRLRNPANAPPDWARAFVVGAVSGEAPAYAHAVLDDGRHGYLARIDTAPLCLGCHGPIDALDAGLRAKLSERYPNDAATGFAAGDVRGWFFAEVDATRAGADTPAAGGQR